MAEWRPLLVRSCIVAGGVGVLAAAWGSGLLELLADRERARALLESLGGWAPVLYVLAFSLLEPFFVPGVLFVLGATAIWPFGTAYALSLAGATGAGVVGFGFARFLARGWVEAHLPARFRRYDEELAGDAGFRTVVWVRLLFFVAPPAHWVLGLSRVRFGPFLVGTAIGFAPMMALVTWLCLQFAERLQTERIGGWMLALAIAVLSIWILRRWRAKAQASAAS